MTTAESARTDTPSPSRIGAYILAGDPVWLTSSLEKYYPLLQDLVVVAATSRLGWTGRPIPVDECLRRVDAVDTRGIARIIWGNWQDASHPLRADTAQRQAGIDALGDGVDWVLQIDNDEILPDPSALLGAIDEADARGAGAVEWPMRVLYRRLRRDRYLEVCAAGGTPRYEYPGPVAVRALTRTVDARRTAGPFLRATVAGDTASLQIRQPSAPAELRLPILRHTQAIVHNSWGRSPSQVRRKIRTWGHSMGWHGEIYYWTRWWPAPATWRWMRDFHPFARGLWPRLTRTDLEDLLAARDR